MENSDFMQVAQRHQIKYRQENISDEYKKLETWLTDKDALNGKNFYNGFSIFNIVKKHHPALCSIYFEMLKSQHIAYDLFIPMRHDLTFCKNVFNEFMGGCIKSIDRSSRIDSLENIKFEFLPKLNQTKYKVSTAFNTLIEYTHKDNTKGLIGLEVKYAHGEYHAATDPVGTKRNSEKDIAYYEITKESNIYKTSFLSKLKGDIYRQIWLNQLLGESILLNYQDKFKHSTLLLFYPKDNEHFNQTGKDYAEMISSTDNKFKTVTYEEYIKACERHCSNAEMENWIDYLQERYIVKQ